jgi:hypothetical protein
MAKPFLCEDGINLPPEVGEKRRSILISVWPNRLQAMSMIIGSRTTAGRPAAKRNRMGVVEADQSLALFIVQRQALAQTVWTFRGRRNLLHNKPDLVFAFGINKECHSIENQELLETVIGSRHLSDMLSDCDDKRQAVKPGKFAE